MRIGPIIAAARAEIESEISSDLKSAPLARQQGRFEQSETDCGTTTFNSYHFLHNGL